MPSEMLLQTIAEMIELAIKNPKSQRFSYVIPQIAPLLRFGMQFPKSRWPLSFSAPESQRFKSQRLEHANATTNRKR